MFFRFLWTFSLPHVETLRSHPRKCDVPNQTREKREARRRKFEDIQHVRREQQPLRNKRKCMSAKKGLSVLVSAPIENKVVYTKISRTYSYIVSF